MNKSIIISRFNEDINWLKQLKDFKKIIIYNKGKTLRNYDNFQIINLDNVGRESHTWIYHIVKNYNNLDDISIFLQGRIDDLGCMAFQDPNDYIVNINRFGYSASRYGLLGPLHWGWNVGIETNIKYLDAWSSKDISRSKIGFRAFSKNLFPNIPFFTATSYGGCFAVKKDLILQYELDFYKNLLKILSKNKNPIEGHYMERLWCYMFTKNKFLLRTFLDVTQTKIERLFQNKKFSI